MGIYQDLGFGDDVGAQVACYDQLFYESTTLTFNNFDLPEGSYAVIVGITKSLEDTCYRPAATTTKGPTRMAVGGSGCLVTPRLLTIEYDCMSGYDIRGPADTLNNDNLYRNARKRFNDANVLLAFQENELTIAPQDFSSFAAFERFILDHWESAFWLGHKTADFYLAGIKNCTNRQQFYGTRPEDTLSSTAVGLSKPAYEEPFAARGASSTVFKEEIDNRLNSGSRQKGYNIDAVHEMGHALARLVHHDSCPPCHNGGVNANCVMNVMLYYTNGDLKSGRDKFCDKCKDTIKVLSW